MIRIEVDRRNLRIELGSRSNASGDSGVEIEDLLDQRVEISRSRRGGWHPGIPREFIHQGLQRIHLMNDGLGALIKNPGEFGGPFGELLAKALGAELDGGQGVLDLMSHPPGHLFPRHGLLGSDELADIIKDHDHAEVLSFPIPQARDIDHEGRPPTEEREGHLFIHRTPSLPDHPVHQMAERGQGVRGEDRSIVSVEGRPWVEVQHPRGCAIHGIQPAFPIQRKDPGPDAFQDRLHVHPSLIQLDISPLQIPVRLRELYLAPAQVPGHPVKGVHQDPDLIICLHLHTIVEVSRRHGPCPLGELLDGDGDPAGHVYANPHGSKDDHQGHHQEQHDIDALDRVPEQLQLLVFSDPHGDVGDLLPHPPGDEIPHRGCPEDLVLTRRENDRHDTPNEIPCRGPLDQRLLPSPQGPPNKARGRPYRFISGDSLAPDLQPLSSPPVKDLDHGQLKFLELLPGEPIEVGLVRVQESLSGDAPSDLPRRKEGPVVGIQIIRLGHFEGTLEGLLHLDVKPGVHVGGDEIGSHEEEQGRREQRETQEGHH